jgi:hypothetical protein
MLRWTWLVPAALLAALLAVPCPAPACSLCSNIQQAQTMRQEAATARLVLYGRAANPRLNAGATGATDLHIDGVIKPDPIVGNKKMVELPRYLPVSDPKDPPRYLVFCDIFKDKLDPYRGVPVKSAAVVDYLKGAMALDRSDAVKSLLYFSRFLEHADKEIARDAFLEFAKAGDREVGQAASQLAPEKVRQWLKDPQTPAERLGLYAFLLGACGKEEDVALLRSMLQSPDERTLPALDGVLAGYLQLRPREGWEQALATLRDEKKPFQVRFAVLRTLRFQYGWRPKETRADVLKGLAALVPQGDIADLAVEDLRRWQLWDLTADVLAQYGKKSHDAPLMRRTLVRYALCCPRPEAAEFVKKLRQSDPALVQEVEESLRADQTPPR